MQRGERCTQERAPIKTRKQKSRRREQWYILDKRRERGRRLSRQAQLTAVMTVSRPGRLVDGAARLRADVGRRALLTRPWQLMSAGYGWVVVVEPAAGTVRRSPVHTPRASSWRQTHQLIASPDQKHMTLDDNTNTDLCGRRYRCLRLSSQEIVTSAKEVIWYPQSSVCLCVCMSVCLLATSP